MLNVGNKSDAGQKSDRKPTEDRYQSNSTPINLLLNNKSTAQSMFPHTTLIPPGVALNGPAPNC